MKSAKSSRLLMGSNAWCRRYVSPVVELSWCWHSSMCLWASGSADLHQRRYAAILASRLALAIHVSHIAFMSVSQVGCGNQPSGHDFIGYRGGLLAECLHLVCDYVMVYRVVVAVERVMLYPPLRNWLLRSKQSELLWRSDTMRIGPR